jgi:hypothetical protein
METSQGNKFGPRQIRLYLVLFGLAFMVFGIYFYLYERDFEARAEKTMGTVTKVRRETSSTTSGGRRTTSIVYRPIIRFELDGRSYSFASKSASSGYKDMKGTRLEILYDPADPSDARIADNRTWLIIGIFIGAGGLIFLAGVFLPRVFKETNGAIV